MCLLGVRSYGDVWFGRGGVAKVVSNTLPCNFVGCLEKSDMASEGAKSCEVRGEPPNLALILSIRPSVRRSVRPQHCEIAI